MKELRADIKSRSFKRVYLFYGTESFLIEKYEASLKESVPQMSVMNLDVFGGKGCSVDGAIDAARTAAFMSDYRLVVLKDTGLFATGRKDDTEKMAAFLPEIPESTVMLFSESQVDKRNRLYKKTTEHGRVVEFSRPSEKELVAWVCRTFDSEGKKISPQTALLLLKTVSGDMRHVVNEAQKLAAYTQSDTIEPADIEAVCVKSLEARIFELVAAVGNKDAGRALDIFNALVLLKESPIMVVSMIARQLRLILQCKALSQSCAPADIASELGLRSFMVGDYLRQGRNFSEDGLILALKRVLDTDMDIKTGAVGDRLAVELLIFSLAG